MTRKTSNPLTANKELQFDRNNDVANFFVTIIIKYIVDVNDKYCIPSEVPSNK